MPSDERGLGVEGGASPPEGRDTSTPWAAYFPAPLPPPPARRRGRAPLAALAATLVLVACGTGVGIGYALFASSPPVATSPTTSTGPGRSPANAPGVAAVAAKVDPGLVDVETTLQYQTAYGAGTGMVVTTSGEVVTNNHVIEGATSLRVTDVGNHQSYSATVVGYDVAADIAVLQIEGASRLRTVSFAKTPPRVGQSVVAIGNAEGRGGTPEAVSGKVTGLHQEITAQDDLSGSTEHLRGMIATDAPVREGDSGGSLVNGSGEVLGMVTAGGSSFAFSQSASEGFAIPIATVASIAEDIEHGRSSSAVHIGPTPFLGVELTDVGTAGAVVVAVLPGTPATAIGLRAGDTITSLGGRPIADSTALASALGRQEPGATIEIGWKDPLGQRFSAAVTLASGPPA